MTHDIGILEELVHQPDFESTLESPDNPVYRDTINLLKATKSDIGDAEIRGEYQRGERNDQIAETFNGLQKMTLERIKGFPASPAVVRKRQFVYTIFLIQTKWLLSLVIMQKKDLVQDSLLFRTLDQTINMLSSLKGMRVDLDPENALTTLVNESESSISNKPNVASTLEELTSLIQ